jgi:hypothetical protein
MEDDSKYDLSHISSPDNRNGIEFEKLRFEYAWRHFDMHARQRLQMFYFFLISVAFLCGVVVSISNSQRPELAGLKSIVAGAGLALCLIFLALDVRNRELYSISRRHLKAIETNILYPDGFREIFEDQKRRAGRVRGIMVEDGGRNYLRHKFLVPICHIIAAGLFAYLFIRFTL